MSTFVKTIREFEDARSKVNCTKNTYANVSDHLADFDERFRNPSYETISDTFKFLFENFKKGIFIQIHRGSVKTFLEFSNNYYTNNWSNIVDFSEGGVDFSDCKIQKKENWYANNYLVRFENPFNENHTGVSELYDLLEETCQKYDIPDVEFFINRRDFPIIRKDECEPYTSIFGSTPANAPANLALIVSMVETDETIDVPFITPDDWSRSCQKSFSTSKRSSTIFKDEFREMSWKTKKEQVLFRGSNTGANFGECRLRLCEMCAQNPVFNVKLTSISSRKQIINGKLLDPIKLGISKRAGQYLGKYLSLREQSQYKYILHIQGHVQSFRLGTMLSLNSVILLVESDSRLWFERWLKPWVHYVPVDKDLSNLFGRVEWCKSHPFECEKMANEGRRFYDTHLTKQGCMKYVAEILCSYRSRMAPTLYTSPSFQITPSPLNCIRKPSGHITTVGRCYASIIQVDPIKDFVESKTVLERTKDSLTILLVPKLSSSETCVGIKRGKRVNYEYTIGRGVINPLIKEVPNFVYTFSVNFDSLYVEEVLERRFTLRNYICSSEFRCDGLLNILKQIALSLAYAQNRCFFIHGCATLDNVILARLPLSEYDVPISREQVWRVSCEELVPIWINYGQAMGISTGGKLISSTRPYEEFPSFKDCLTIFLAAIKESFRIGALSNQQRQLISSIVDTIFKDTDGFMFKSGLNLREFMNGISEEYLLNSKMGNVLNKNPMDLFDAISDSRFTLIKGVEQTHFGKVSAIYSLPKEDTELLNRYYHQWLSKISIGGAKAFIETNYDPVKSVCDGWYIRDKNIMNDNVGVHISSKTLRLLNIIEEVLTDGSTYALRDKERQELVKKSETLFNNKNTIWSIAAKQWTI